MNGIKRDRRDHWHSLLVRESFEWTCQRCHRKFMPPHSGLHNAHFWTRRTRSIRWWPWASAAACYGCHQYLDSHPDEKETWARALVGDQKYDEGVMRKSMALRLRKSDLEFIRNQLKGQYEAMMAKRRAGVTGRIEFASPYPAGAKILR